MTFPMQLTNNSWTLSFSDTLANSGRLAPSSFFNMKFKKKRASSCKMRPFGLARDDKRVSIFIDGTPLLVTIEKMFGVTFDKM